MNVNFNNVGIGTGNFGVSQGVEGKKAEGQMAKIANSDLRLSGAQALDVLHGSEPVAEVPAEGLSREDDLGRLVSSVFNLPPPPMPDFNG